MSKPVFVISGPFDTFSGYGARARDVVKAIIESDKYDVKLLFQKWGDCSWGFIEDNPEWEFLNKHKIPNMDSKPDIWMQITIPVEFQPVGTYNIGCTAGIESTGCDPAWITGVNRMNECWVSSEHSKKVFSELVAEKRDKTTNQIIENIKVQVPIKTVFEGGHTDVWKKVSTKDSDVVLDDIKEEFCYLFVGHWMQGAVGHDRKNVGYMIKSFFETFKNKKKKPGLILKASIGNDSYMSRDEVLKRILSIRKSVNSDDLPNVYLFNGDLTNEELNELYNNPKVKAMVCLTKGEGFGRPLLEFSFVGKPIICSGWSGHMDFLNPEFTKLLPGELEPVHPSAANKWLLKETSWFKPSDEHVGKAWLEVYNNYKQWSVLGKKQGHYARTNFSFDKMKELITNILDKSIPDFPKKVDIKLPTANVELPKLQ